MTIDAQCKACQKRYRVNESLAGRTAECKHCGAKFRIPYRSAVVRLDDVEEVEAEAAPAERAPAPKKAPTPAAPVAANMRTFEEYAPLVPKPKKSRLDEPTENNVSPIPLPGIVTDLWLPIAIMVICYGVALFVSVNAVLHSYGVGAGFIMIGLVVASLFIVIIPLTVKAIDSASGTFDFKLSNSLWTQAAAIVSVPIMCGTIGLVTGGLIGTLVGTAIGVAAAIPLTMLLLQISVGSGLQTSVLASLFFLLGTGGTAVAVWVIAAVLFPIWYLNLPWGDAPAQTSPSNTVVAVNTTVAPTPEPAPATQASAVEAKSTTPAPEPAAAPAAPAVDAPAPTVAAGVTIFTDTSTSAGALPPAPAVADAPAVTVASAATHGRPVDELLPPAPTPGSKLPPAPPAPVAELIKAAPTTAPAATAALAAQKQWVVTIVSLHRPDTSAINAQMADVGGQIPAATAEARTARDRANFLESQFETVRDYNPRGVEGEVRVEKKYRHSKAERGKASAAALRAENDVKKLQNRIAQLERDRAELERALIISGRLDDGTLVEIETGPREARLAEALQPGTQWKVDGLGKVAVGVLEVKPRLLQPFTDDLQAATPQPPRP